MSLNNMQPNEVDENQKMNSVHNLNVLKISPLITPENLKKCTCF